METDVSYCMNPSIEKRQALASAHRLLSSSPPAPANFIALELRRCIEAVVYEKLLAYEKRLPLKARKTWQPPQAFKALALFEPNVFNSRIVSWSCSSNSGTESKIASESIADFRFSLKWLNKNYNKLGKLLHAHWPFDSKSFNLSDSNWMDYLSEIVSTLDGYVENTFTSTFAIIVEFQCSVCDQVIKINEHALALLTVLECFNPDCECLHSIHSDGRDYIFKPVGVWAKCESCSFDIFVPENRLKLGYLFSCQNCEKQHRLLEPTWHYGVVSNEVIGIE